MSTDFMNTRKHHRSWPAVLVFMSVLACCTSVQADTLPQWTALEFSASKFFMTAHFGVDARMLPTTGLSSKFLDTPDGQPIAAGDEIIELNYHMSGFGRQSAATLWIDPDTAASLQQSELDSGRRQRLREYRFTDIGAWHFSRWPASSSEQALDPAQWTDRSEGLRSYPAAARGKPVSSATTLLWLAAAGDYHEPGDRGEVLIFSRRQVHRIVMEVVGQRQLRVDYREQQAGSNRQRRDRVDALVMEIRSEPFDPSDGDSEDFDLFGLQGDLELLLDPVTRIPLQLSGAVKIAGQVTVRLRNATLR